MPKNRVHQGSKQQLYFITPTIWNWYYIFDRRNRWQIVAHSLKFCQETKGLEIYAYVFMLNHLHLIIRSPDAAGFFSILKNLRRKN